MAKAPKAGAAKSPKVDKTALAKAGELDSGSFVLSQNGQDVCWMHSAKDASGNGTERWYWIAGFSNPTTGNPVTWDVRRDVFAPGNHLGWIAQYRPLTQTWKRHTVVND